MANKKANQILDRVFLKDLTEAVNKIRAEKGEPPTKVYGPVDTQFTADKIEPILRIRGNQGKDTSEIIVGKETKNSANFFTKLADLSINIVKSPGKLIKTPNQVVEDLKKVPINPKDITKQDLDDLIRSPESSRFNVGRATVPDIFNEFADDTKAESMGAKNAIAAIAFAHSAGAFSGEAAGAEGTAGSNVFAGPGAAGGEAAPFTFSAEELAAIEAGEAAAAGAEGLTSAQLLESGALTAGGGTTAGISGGGQLGSTLATSAGGTVAKTGFIDSIKNAFTEGAKKGKTWTDIIQLGSAAYSAYTQAEAAGDSADAISEATNLAIEEQRRQFDVTTELQEPFRQAGLRSTEKLETEADRLQGAAQQGDELYEFQLQELGKNLARRGFSGQSGTAIKAEVGLAASEAVRRQGLLNQRIQVLQGLAGQGLQTAGNLGQQSQQLGTNVGNLQLQSGQAQAQGLQQAGQARGAFFSGFGGFVNNQQPNQQQKLNQQSLGIGGF